MGGNDQQASFDAELEATPVVVREDVPTGDYKNNATVRLSFNAAGNLYLITTTILALPYYNKVEPAYTADSVENTYQEFQASVTSL